jgi:hypothetical protein
MPPLQNPNQIRVAESSPCPLEHLIAPIRMDGVFFRTGTAEILKNF